MAASKGFTGKGTVFSVGVTGAPETFVAIAQLKTLQFAGQKLNFDDVTNLDSVVLGTSAAILKEQIPATADPGTLAIAGIFLPGDAGKADLDVAYLGAALTDFKIQLPKGPGQAISGNLYTFSGYIVEQPLPDIQFDKVLNFKTTIQLNTAIVITPGS